MSIEEVKVPDVGDFDEIPVIEVLVKAGDRIEKEQSLITLESEKATMEVPAPLAGTVKEMKVKEGDTTSEGDVIATVEAEEAAAEPEGAGEEAEPEEDTPDEAEADEPEPAGESAPEPEAPVPPPAADGDADEAPSPANLPHASPSVRRFARELGVDLQGVEGSARKGRITREDVQKHVKGVMQSAGPATGPGLDVAAPPKVDFSRFGKVEVEPLGRVRRLAGANVHRNWVTVPHVTQHDEADITELEAFRKANQDEAAAHDAKLTLVAFLIKAAVAGLKRFPRFNSSLDETGERLVMKRYFHIGIAVDTREGLLMPVLRDCDQKGLIEIAQELGGISERARDGKLTMGEMQGACFSISSLGGIGGTSFTPIVNMPEVAILGVSRASTQPVWDGEAFQPRLMLPLSLSYDHRVIDGADAARFTRYLGGVLGDLRRVLL